ncbi:MULTISPECIES: PadR family transcriptional regulator [unclassified Kitasatospora]|uniref:PadR family transcriptional regulator n=1 Tax=unclassified Kitasatospora TaxID=2633591 RepID=UPI00070C018C|nr:MULTISPECIES: PadR family transcriptional regulator [unclassified Kitasatospora]KQV15466.1 PadR family transcriptional regulator [Kitasatospora sp. Root107]KRB63947.1 PadR family transcriptional regulator [Kitasatospora sp. Root187]
MLKLAILGLLQERPLHGYELRRHLAALTGHVRPISDGTLYPAIKRLETAGLLIRETEPGTAAAPRHTLHLTEAGQAALLARLRAPEELDITDENRWFTVLAFLRQLGDPAEQAAVLRRRLAFLNEPASFFYDGERPLGAEEFDDPFRRGLLLIARATTQTELSWLTETIAELDEH